MLFDDYQLYETYAALSAPQAPQTGIYRIRPGRGARDVYGFNTDQKIEIGLALIDIVRKVQNGSIVSATIELDDQRKLVFHQWFQAANFYERLTGNELMSGMAGTPKKLVSKKNVGARWHDNESAVKYPPQPRSH